MNSIFKYHLITIIISLFFLFRRYKNDPYNFLLNYNTYLLVFAVLYFSLPSMINLSTMMSPVTTSEDTIIFSSKVGLYFHLIFLLGFLMTNNLKHNSLKKVYLTKNSLIIVSFSGFIISLYMFLLIMINLDYIISIYGNRRLQANFDQLLNTKYKIYFLYNYLVIVTSFLVLTTKKIKYLLLSLPFLLLAILISDRDFLLKGFLLLVILYTIIGHKIKGKYLVFFPALLVAVGLLRGGFFDSTRFLIQSSSEFLFTWSTTHLIIESPDKMDVLTALSFSLYKVTLPGVYEFLFGEYKHYHEIITVNNPLIAGLGGSVVSEALSFKNNFITVVMPFAIIFYGFTMNKLLRLKFYSGKIIFILSILLMHSVIRFTFLENAFYPVFLIWFFGFWVIWIDFKSLNKNNG